LNFTNWNASSPSSASLNELYDLGSNPGTDNNVALGCAWATKAAAGATGDAGFECTPNTSPRTMGGFILALKASFTPGGTFRTTFTSNETFTVPSCVTSLTVEAWGGGGGGRDGDSNGGGKGGGGGGYAIGTIANASGEYSVTVGTGGTMNNNGTASTFGSTLVVANGGSGGTGSVSGGGTGGTASTSGVTNVTTSSGGPGGNGNNTDDVGGGGGGAAGPNGNGAAGAAGASNVGGNGGRGNNNSGGNGGNGGNRGDGANGSSNVLGGGGGGGADNGRVGGNVGFAGGGGGGGENGGGSGASYAANGNSGFWQFSALTFWRENVKQPTFDGFLNMLRQVSLTGAPIYGNTSGWAGATYPYDFYSRGIMPLNYRN
jgi:hypothetical protein